MAPRPRTTPRCDNCRRRKVKCDYQKPSCGRCLQSRLPCGTTSRDIVIVQYLAPSPSNTASTSGHSNGDSPPPARAPKVTTKPPTLDSSIPSPTYQHSWSASSLQSLSMLLAPSPNNNRFDLFNLFLSQYLPSQTSSYQLCVDWFDYVSDCQGPSAEPLKIASDALTTTIAGQVQGDKDLIRQGWHMYSIALTKQIKWKASKSGWQIALLTAIMLQIYETVCDTPNTGVGGWKAHILGICSLLRALGPEAVQEGGMHVSFLAARTSVLSASVAFEVTTIFGTPEWLTVPWAKKPKTNIHALIDKLQLLPSLMHLSTELSSTELTLQEDQVTEKLQHFHQLRRVIDESIDSWYYSVVSSRPATIIKTVPASDGDDTVFDHEIQFPSLSDGHMFMFYWDAKLRCHEAEQRVMGSIIALPRANRKRSAAAQQPPCIAEVVSYADCICQGAKSMQASEFGIIGVQFTMFPLQSAMRLYREQGIWEKEKWCRDNIQGLTRRPHSKLPRLILSTTTGEASAS